MKRQILYPVQITKELHYSTKTNNNKNLENQPPVWTMMTPAYVAAAAL